MTFFILISALFSGSIAIAHGENKLGPNGGYIRMPGAFHTEVVAKSPNQIQVYLLDLEWKNPSVNSSSVKAYLNGKKKYSTTCVVENNFYRCDFEKGARLDGGQLVIEAKRENQVGNKAIYDLPLKLEETQKMHH